MVRDNAPGTIGQGQTSKKFNYTLLNRGILLYEGKMQIPNEVFVDG